MLSDDLSFTIMKFLDSKDIINIIQVDKKNLKLYRHFLKEKIIIENFHKSLIKAFGLNEYLF